MMFDLSRNNIGISLPRQLSHLAQLEPERYQLLQHHVSFLQHLRRLVFLEVDADGHPY